MALGTATLLGLGAGSLLGGANYLHGKKQAGKAAELNSKTAQYSPWTGMAPRAKVDNPSLLGDVVGGATTGALFGTQFNPAAAAAPLAATPDIDLSELSQPLQGAQQAMQGMPPAAAGVVPAPPELSAIQPANLRKPRIGSIYESMQDFRNPYTTVRGPSSWSLLGQ